MAKRHHYAPVTYLRGFTDAEGLLHVYRKDAPATPWADRTSEARSRIRTGSDPPVAGRRASPTGNFRG